MAESEKIVINIDIDGIKNKIDKISNILSNGISVFKGEFDEVQARMDGIAQQIVKAGADFITTIDTGFGNLITEIDAIRDQLNTFAEQQGAQATIDTALKAFELTGDL